MAHKKGGGSSKNGRDSNSQRLGIKAYGGELVTAGSILVRQRGTVFAPGKNVMRAKDDSLFTIVNGHVKFEWVNKHKKRISVYPPASAAKKTGK